MKIQKGFAIIPVIVVIAVLAVGGYWYWQSKPSKNEKHESFKTYAECVKDTKLPCKHYFVGDLGQEWRPSPYLSKKECDDSERVVGFTCVVPPGSFREARWINGADIETANRENETSSWKTYNSTKFGYSFKYPSGYSLKEEGDYARLYESSKTDFYGNAQSMMDFHGQESNASLDSIVKDTDVLRYAKSITINGLQAYEGIDLGIVNSYAILIKNDSNIVEIIFRSGNKDTLQENRSALTDIQRQILSTFKFINTGITAKTGTLKGKVSIGPVCPVERLDSPCPVPLATYTSREVIVYKTDGKTVADRMHFGVDGSYSFNLSPGSYVLDIAKLGIDRATDLPKTVEIKAGQTTTVNFSIDTGIR